MNKKTYRYNDIENEDIFNLLTKDNPTTGINEIRNMWQYYQASFDRIFDEMRTSTWPKTSEK